jgi:hypothetical protein
LLTHLAVYIDRLQRTTAAEVDEEWDQALILLEAGNNNLDELLEYMAKRI